MLCALIAGAATVLAAGAEYRSRKSARRADARAARRATESRLAMDLMYATCSLSLTTAKKLAGQHTNGDVEEAMRAAETASRRISASSAARRPTASVKFEPGRTRREDGT